MEVVQVKPSKRLVNSPCIVVTSVLNIHHLLTQFSFEPIRQVNHDSAAYLEMMKLANMDSGIYGTRQELEVNLDHKILVQLNDIRETKPDLAKDVAEQVFDNALVSAGILEDPRSMVKRINSLLEVCMAPTDGTKT